MLPEGGLAMYCARCRRQLFYQNLDHQGWCEDCTQIVGVSQCKVSYWCVAAVIALLWVLPTGICP
jgi:hypothetical protein